MGIAAVDICERQRLSFAKVFSQQFLMSPKGDLSLPGFQENSFAGWHLYVGSTLPIAIAQMSEPLCGLVVLGRAVDAEGHLVTSERLAAVLPRMVTPDALQAYVEGLGGRYAAFVQSGKIRRCYLDLSGTMGVVANRENRMIGSTLYMVLTDKIRPNTEFPQGSEPRRFAFGHTADKNVRALTPNHYFDLSDHTETRHWPKEESLADQSLDDLDAGIDKVIQRHGQIIRALSDTEQPVILPLSGGEDTRQLLAMTLACDCLIDLRFSHITTWKSQSDAQIAEQLCETVGIEMETYRCDGSDTALRPRLIKRLLTERAVATGATGVNPEFFSKKGMGKKFIQVGRELAATRLLPPGGTVLRGHVTDISKAVLWRNIGIKSHAAQGGAGISPETGLKLLMLDSSEAQNSPCLKQKYAEWLATLPPAAQERSIDFMGLELYRTYSLGTLFYALNRNFYMSPGCDRQIIQNLVSAPPRLWYDFHYNDRLLAATVATFLDISYARGNDDLTRSDRPPLDANPETYGLQKTSAQKTAQRASKSPHTGEQIRTPLLRSVVPGGKTLWMKNEAAQLSGCLKFEGLTLFSPVILCPTKW